MKEIILEIKNIKKHFFRQIRRKNGDLHNESLAILNDCNLKVEKGKVTAIIGGNGSGKTTLFNILSRLINAEKGELNYLFNEKWIDLNKKSPQDLAKLGIGRLFQDNHIFPKMSILDNMLIAQAPSNNEYALASLFLARKINAKEEKAQNKVKIIFEQLFGLPNPFWENRENLAETLSYGQQRLLGLARLFMGNYQIILLDEPTAGVNLTIIQQMKDMVKRMTIQHQISILLIEHHINFIRDIADYCAFLHEGKIEAFGPIQEVLDNPKVRESYLGFNLNEKGEKYA